MVEKKKLYTAVAAIGVVVVLVGAAFVFLGAQSTATGYRIVANVNKDCAGTPWFVGEDIGYFEANDINFVDAGALDWTLQSSALASGQTNVYDGHPNSVINLIEAGAKVHGVLLTGQEPAATDTMKLHMLWLTLKSSPYDNYIDLVKGFEANGTKAKVAIGGTGICADLENNALLRSAGLSVNDIQQVILPDPQMLAALESGAVDVIVPHPPFYTAALATGDVKYVATSSDALGTNAGVGLLVFTDDFIANHPDAVRAFIQAYKSSLQWSNDHSNESGRLTADTIGLTTANTHWYSYNGTITDAEIQPWIDAMVADGDLKPGQIKPSDIYTTEFSDLWGNETAPQPLDPFGSATNAKYGWFNQTNDVVTANHYVADLQSVANLETVSASDVVNHYAAVGNVSQTISTNGTRGGVN